MTCREYRKDLMELARGAGLPPAERRSLLAHVETCEACARYLEAQTELTASAEALASIRIASPEQFAARVMAEFDAAQPRRVPARRWALAGALAACLCLGAVWIERQGRVDRTAGSRPFLTIPYTLPLAPEEPAAVVRTEIPVKQLIAAGFHVDAPVPDPEATVEADVLVGPDGRARAVRPVSIWMSN